MAQVRVGTSGWQYRDWRGAFYPDGLAMTRWFDHYVRVFPTVEVNATFYRLPRPTTVDRWSERAPAGFRYAVKGSRYITHNLKLGDGTDTAVRNVTERIAPLGDHLGAWLWQLSGNLHRDDQRLDRFLGMLPTGPRHAVEFRHGSWFDDEVFAILERHGAACVWISDRQTPDVFPVTADVVYVRFHGLATDDAERYRYDYTREELAPWAERLSAQREAGRDVWVYFNNDHAARAPANALTLMELLGDAARRP